MKLPESPPSELYVPALVHVITRPFASQSRPEYAQMKFAGVPVNAAIVVKTAPLQLNVLDWPESQINMNVPCQLVISHEFGVVVNPVPTVTIVPPFDTWYNFPSEHR